MWTQLRNYIETCAWTLVRCRLDGAPVKFVDRRRTAVATAFTKLTDERITKVQGRHHGASLRWMLRVSVRCAPLSTLGDTARTRLHEHVSVAMSCRRSCGVAHLMACRRCLCDGNVVSVTKAVLCGCCADLLVAHSVTRTLIHVHMSVAHVEAVLTTHRKAITKVFRHYSERDGAKTKSSKPSDISYRWTMYWPQFHLLLQQCGIIAGTSFHDSEVWVGLGKTPTCGTFTHACHRKCSSARIVFSKVSSSCNLAF